MTATRFFTLLGVMIVLCGCAKSDSASTPGTAADAGVKRFVFITNGDDPFWDACHAGLVEGANRCGLDAKGLRVVMEMNNGTAQGQIE